MQSFMFPSYYEFERELGSRQKKQYQKSISRVVGENASSFALYTGTMKKMSLIKNVEGPTLVKRKRK